MATPSNTPLGLTGDNIIDASIHGYYWRLDSSRTIRWAVAGGLDGEFWNNPSAVAAYIDVIFDTVSYYANVQFEYVGAFTNPVQAAQSADISISLSGSTLVFPSSLIWGRAFFPNIAEGILAGDVFLNINSQANFLPTYAAGSAGYFFFLHEIGHALGLKHPHDDGGTGHPTLADIGLAAFDVDWFSIMSYEDDFNFNIGSWDPATPMLLDVLGIQYLYGPNMSTNAGDETYTLPRNNFYATIWDAAGNDTIDLTNSTVGWTVYLPDIQLSSLVSTKAGYAAPTSELSTGLHNFYWLTGEIENLVGSTYADTLVGSASDNALRGFGGNDTIDGGDGFDRAYYSGLRSVYTIMKREDGFSVSSKTGSEGTDLIAGIEQLIFSDTSLAIEYNDVVQSLYVAYFGRAADTSGLANFQAQLATINGPRDIQSLNAAYGTSNSIRTLIDAFGTSDESNALYSGDTRSFVTAIYNNVLSRNPDQGGLDFWTNAIDFGGLSRGNASLSIMAGAQTNTSTQGLVDAALVSKKITVASNFTFSIDTSSKVSAYSGNEAAATVRAMLANISVNTDTDAFQTTINATLTEMMQTGPLLSNALDQPIQLAGIVPTFDFFA